VPNTLLSGCRLSAIMPGMFLRRKTKSVRGVGYSYWHLCQTVRTARGPRQRVVASLGKLDEAQCAGLTGGWDDLSALLRGHTPQPKLDTAALPGFDTTEAAPPARWEQADLKALRWLLNPHPAGFVRVTMSPLKLRTSVQFPIPCNWNHSLNRSAQSYVSIL